VQRLVESWLEQVGSEEGAGFVVEVVEPRRLGSESSLVWRWWSRTTRHSLIRPRSHATPEIAKETPITERQRVSCKSPIAPTTTGVLLQ